jgi:hypothetical protein
MELLQQDQAAHIAPDTKLHQAMYRGRPHIMVPKHQKEAVFGVMQRHLVQEHFWEACFTHLAAITMVKAMVFRCSGFCLTS